MGPRLSGITPIQREFPRGQLSEEREALAVQALARRLFDNGRCHGRLSVGLHARGEIEKHELEYPLLG